MPFVRGNRMRGVAIAAAAFSVVGLSACGSLPKLGGKSNVSTADNAAAIGGPIDLLDGDSMDKMVRLAEQMAASTISVPEHLRGKAYMLELDEVAERAVEAWQRGATEVCMQGGIHPSFTGQTYLDILQALFIVFTVQPWHHNIARALLQAPKVYFYDIGLVQEIDAIWR